MVAQYFEVGRRPRIAPRNVAKDFSTDMEMPIDRFPFPFAEGAPVRALQQLSCDVVGRDIPARRMAGLQRAHRPVRVGDHDAPMLDPDMSIGGKRDWRDAVSPIRSLAGASGLGHCSHAASFL